MIFSLIVMFGNRLNCWNTIPIFSRISLISTDSSVISTPSNVTTPLVGSSNRFNERRNVDFPQPEGPMIAMTSPFFTVMFIPFKTSCFPKDLCKSFTSINVSPFCITFLISACFLSRTICTKPAQIHTLSLL